MDERNIPDRTEPGFQKDDIQPGETDLHDDALVRIEHLHTHFHTDRGVVKAVDGVDLTVPRNRTIGVVGESGCGKSVMALSIMGLVARPPAHMTGHVWLQTSQGTTVDMVAMHPKGRAIRSLRGREVAMIFQEPMTSLNPLFTVGHQIAEALRLHHKLTKKEAMERAVEQLDQVGISAPQRRVHSYPHELSGGMRQRVMIAMALSCNPSLLIADEPTTALDATIQAQILDLMEKLQAQYNTAIMMITHDLGVVAGLADKVAVMYLGQVVEVGPVRRVFKDEGHPYTEGLMQSIPILGRSEGQRLTPIRGMVPDPRMMPTGCRFAERCPRRMPVCDTPPPMVALSPDHAVRCWLFDDAKEVSDDVGA